MPPTLRLLPLACLLATVTAKAIDNEVTNSAVQCTTDAITVDFTTRNNFEGRIFVKGMVESPSCVQSYSEESSPTTTPTMSFSFGDCRMKRARTVLVPFPCAGEEEPGLKLAPQRGMMQSLVVIISFHSTFVTKVDRAYRVQCFYMEAEKTVTSSFEVSMLTTDDLRDTGSMPTCTYSVHRGAVDGPVVKFATVGEEVYHKWVCDSDTHRLLVKSCYVDDGASNRYDIIDDRGCAIDKIIMGDLEYGGSDSRVAMVSVEAHVFKFADKPNVFFQCTIQLCSKNQAECDDISPPACPTRHRAFALRRQRRALSVIQANASLPSRAFGGADEMDLFSELITVADLEDSPSAAQTGGREEEGERREWEEEEERARVAGDAVCFSPTGLGVLLSLIAIVFLLAITVTCILCVQRHAANPLKPYNVRA